MATLIKIAMTFLFKVFVWILSVDNSFFRNESMLFANLYFVYRKLTKFEVKKTQMAHGSNWSNWFELIRNYPLSLFNPYPVTIHKSWQNNTDILY